jgi:UDP-glucuronate 4-epimerase
VRTLVTGAAGFIGYHVAARLLSRGDVVLGVDNFDDHYDRTLKERRAAQLLPRPGFSLHRVDCADADAMARLFDTARPDRVIHLAARVGVRTSVTHPRLYTRSNVDGFLSVLEGCRAAGVRHLVYASSSSVYGANTTFPASEHHPADHPVSLYAATKRSNELMAHAYSSLFGLPTTGLRFFTVYGPWGRPDMAVSLFTAAILEGRPIELFNGGDMARDFTYVDDVVEGVVRAADQPPAPNPAWSGVAPADPATSAAPYRLYNVGNHTPVPLARLIAALEAALGRRAIVTPRPLPPGDVLTTCADVADLSAAVGFAPDTPIEEGVRRFVAWYLEYRGG